jgi:hypothetical protein
MSMSSMLPGWLVSRSVNLNSARSEGSNSVELRRPPGSLRAEICSALTPRRLAEAAWDLVQYSQPLRIDTAR